MCGSMRYRRELDIVECQEVYPPSEDTFLLLDALEVGEGETVLELRVAPEDMGRVIGRQGRIAKEIRTLIRSYAQRTGVKASVDIVD